MAHGRRARLGGSLLALALGAGALSGCDESRGPISGPEATAAVEPTSPSGPSPRPSISDPPRTPAPVEEEVFEEGASILRVAVSEPATLDPMRIHDPGSLLVARQLYEGLTRWDPADEEVVPAAADDWRVSDGGRTYTFQLEEDMTYHDGTPVVAKDFKFAFERIAKKTNASDLAYTLERVEGFEAVHDLGRTNRLSGIKAPRKYRLVIKLVEPDRDFPAVLTHPGLVPLARRTVKDVDEFLRRPIGNGSFMMARDWAPGDEVILEAFPEALDAPELDGMRFIPYQDAAVSWKPFLDAEVDVAEVPAGQVRSARTLFGARGFAPLLAGYYYGLNLTSPNLANIRMRRAINRAIDREAIIEAIFKETMTPPRGILPVGMPGFDDDACGKLCDHSRKAARRLLKKVPRRMRTVTVQFNRGRPHTQVARLVRRDLVRVGLRVKLRKYPFPKFLRLLRADEQSVYRLGWIAEYPSPDAFLTPLFKTSSPDNHSSFGYPRLDDLLARARSDKRPKKRLKLYARAEKLILERAPIVPIGSFVSRWAARPRVEDFELDVMGGFDAAGMSLRED